MIPDSKASGQKPATAAEDRREDEDEEDAKAEGNPMNWGDNVPGASTLLAKRLVRSISGQNFDLLVYAAGATLVVVDVRTTARCLQRRYYVFPASVDSRRGRRIECEQPHTDTIRDLVYNPELQLLLSGGDDKRWACWDVPSMRVRAQVRICGFPARYTRSFV